LFIRIEIFESSLDFVEASKQLDGLLSDSALMVGSEIEEFTLGVREVTGPRTSR